MRGSRTGVYIGHTKFGMPDGYPQELQLDLEKSLSETKRWLFGSGKNMYANGLSFAFDFKGPSIVMDTAC